MTMTVIFIIVVNFYSAYQFIYDSSVKLLYISTLTKRVKEKS